MRGWRDTHCQVGVVSCAGRVSGHTVVSMVESAIDILRNVYRSFGVGIPLAARELFDQQLGAEANWYVGETFSSAPHRRGGKFAIDSLFSVPAGWEITGATPNQIIEHGDVVTVTGHMQCRPKGGWTTVSVPFIHVWTMCRGKAQRVVSYLDGIEIIREVPLEGCTARSRHDHGVAA